MRWTHISAVLAVLLGCTVLSPRSAAEQRPHDETRTTSIREAASLRIDWTGELAGRQLAASLVPTDADPVPGLSAAESIARSTQPVTGAATQWDAVPHGTYLVVVHSGATGGGGGVPVEVAEVVLGPGDRRVIRATVPAPAEIDATPRGDIRVRVTGATADPLRLAVWRDGGLLRLRPEVERQEGGALLVVRSACGSADVLVVESGARVGVTAEGSTCGETLELVMRETVTIEAQLRVPEGLERPRGAILESTSCEGGETFAVPFEIDAARIRMPAVAGCTGASLRTPGFAPHRLPAGAGNGKGARDAGEIALAPGAAAAFRIRSGSDREPVSAAQVSAIRASDLARLRDLEDVDRVAVATTRTNAMGWARLAPLPEEKLLFAVRRAGRTHPQLTEPYLLPAGRETVLADVILEELPALYVRSSIPEELQGELQLDAVELHPSGHSHWPPGAPLRVDWTSDGAVFEDVPPGTWRIRATGRLKNGFAVTVAQRDVQVFGGTEQTVLLDVHDRLYRGRVTRAGAAVTGTINVRPKPGGGASRPATAKIDEDGRFVVLLEGKGEYSVVVQDAEKRTVTPSRYFAFDDAESEVDIELPAGRVTGRVVDSSGTGIRRALVTATLENADPAGAAAALTGDDGTFELEGVTAGKWKLVAESATARSRPEVLTAHDGAAEGVTLLLEETANVRITVVDPNGARAELVSVSAEFWPHDGSASVYAGGLTRAAGHVELRLSPWQQTAPVNVIVRSVRDRVMTCDVRRLDGDQLFQLPPAVGAVRLISPGLTAPPGGRNWLVSSRGCAVSFYVDREREPDGREAVIFPALAAGTWSLVQTRTPAELQAVFTGRAATLPAMSRFTVEPGKTTRVELR